jgi:hypothetical protein
MPKRKPDPAEELPPPVPLKTPWLRDPYSFISPSRCGAFIESIFNGAQRPGIPT